MAKFNHVIPVPPVPGHVEMVLNNPTPTHVSVNATVARKYTGAGFNPLV